jgi:hypothetical protein
MAALAHFSLQSRARKTPALFATAWDACWPDYEPDFLEINESLAGILVAEMAMLWTFATGSKR